MELVERLALVVPLAAIGLVLVITSINVFIRFRRRFAATVNCWFCNENTKVAYDDSNSWECPNCQQYNGFTADGDYNRDIPAQRVSKMNASRFARASASNANDVLPASNGLCEPCNRNQELKMQQLASFVPVDEQTFDEEVDAFRRKLDQAYRLCPRCERQLKRTLTRVKQNVLGSKLAEIGAKGMEAFDLHISATNRKIIQNRKRRLTRLCGATLIVLAIINCIRTSRNARFTRSTLNMVFPHTVTTVILVSIAALSIAKGFVFSVFAYLMNMSWISTTLQWISSYFVIIQSKIHLDEVVHAQTINATIHSYDVASDHWISIAPILLSVLVVWMNNFRRESLLMLLCWSIKCALSSAASHNTSSPDLGVYFTVLFDILQTLADVSVIITSTQDAFTRTTLFHKIRTNNTSFHRIYADADELSDDSDMETTLSSTRSQNTHGARSKYSPRTSLNASIDTTRSLSPSVFTPSTLRANMTSSVLSLNQSFCDRPHVPTECASPPLPSFNRMNHTTFNLSPTPTLNTHNKFQSMQSLNSFYDVPDEFQSGITQLNISCNHTTSTQPTSRPPPSYCGSQISLNAFAFGDSALDQQLRYRSNSIIEPSRLQPNGTVDATSSKASWIAGGYWNQGMSPTKRTSVVQGDTRRRDPPMFPIMSRTSSQSSGFESHENESRESSVGPNNTLSADAFYNNINPSDSVSQCGRPDYQSAAAAAAVAVAPPMPSPGGYTMFSAKPGSHAGNGFPTIGQSHGLLNSDASSSIFGRPRTRVNDADRQGIFDRGNDRLARWGQAPPIERGSLLKSWAERNSQLDIRLS